MNTLQCIRVLLALDGLAGDLLEQLLKDDDAFELVGRSAPADALDSAQRFLPDFVVIGTQESACDDAVALFNAVPRMQILCLEISEGHAYLTQRLDDVSPLELTDALRIASHRKEE